MDKSTLGNQDTPHPRQHPLEVRQVPTAWLKPYDGNAKLHPPEQVERLAASIKRFGFTNPVLAQPDGTLIAGHGRHIAAMHIGLKEIPCIVIDDMTPEEARAYCLADNRLSDLGSWDKDLLESELIDIKEEDPSLLAAAGYTDDEVEKLLASFEVDEAKLPDLDDGDKVPFQQRTFTMHNDQVEIVDAAIDDAKAKGLGLSAINENGNGNAIFAICRHFIDTKNEG